MRIRNERLHLERLAALFRQRRFAEAMEYLDKLTTDERDRLCRMIGDKRQENSGRKAGCGG